MGVGEGAAFMAMPFHMGHVLGHQHLVALGYLPLYLMFLLPADGMLSFPPCLALRLRA